MKNVIRKRRAYIREIEREEKMDFERTSDPDMLELFFGPEGVKGSGLRSSMVPKIKFQNRN